MKGLKKAGTSPRCPYRGVSFSVHRWRGEWWDMYCTYLARVSI